MMMHFRDDIQDTDFAELFHREASFWAAFHFVCQIVLSNSVSPHTLHLDSKFSTIIDHKIWVLRMRRHIFSIFLLLLLLSAMGTAQERIMRIAIDGSINPASAKYVRDALREASDEQMHAVIVRMNTPGGLLQSTRDIVSDFLEIDIPIIVYVAPGGAQAASAGAFITMAAHIAAMAPGTNIGAAHPVTIGEGESNIADSSNIPLTKATEDAAAFARSIAEARGRNVEWAELAVRGSASITEREALDLNVIDLVANDDEDLLSQLHGWNLVLKGDSVVLNTQNASIVQRDMTFQQKILDLLSNPNIAYLLLMFGIYGLFFELYNPGTIFPGVVGGICLILAFYSMNTLPVNYAGLALILFSIILFILEIKVVSHGLLSIGGVIALFFGSIMLIDTPPGLEFMQISLTVILTITACTTAFFLFVIGKGIAAMRRQASTGTEGMVGERGVVLEDIAPLGVVAVHGERWKARCKEGDISAGSVVVVRHVNNLELLVESVDEKQTSN